MKRLYLLFLLAMASSSFAQSTADYAIQLTATVQTAPAQIKLQWKRLADTTTYQVFRKAKSAFAWSAPIATIPTSDSTYTDNSVVADSAYEYLVVGNHTSVPAWVAKGYIYAGIRCPAIHNRGALVLIADSTFSDSCAAGIQQLAKDLSGDGWKVIRHNVARSLPDTSVKALIKADKTADASVKAVLLLGHVAVPYSGDMNPDGHPEHLGAWPADAFYAYLTAPWTDATVNDVSAGYPANWNTPGDGKLDQVGWSTFADLQVGRIDFFDMPAFAASEVQLMNSYLQRDHAYKMDALGVRHRGIISDNFGPMDGEAFATSGWRNFAPLLGIDSFGAAPFISSLNTGSYQWAYGCGPGGFNSAGGIGSTADFATNNVNGIFTMLFGSYFGDWNVQNNFLRAPLCSAVPALTSCWAGRPNWYFHHMALGDNIGYAQWISQINDGSLYGPANIYGIHQWVHIALMGDVSLRTDYIKPVPSLTITPMANHGATISWAASPDVDVTGYYVYRSDAEFGQYTRLSGMLATLTFTDTVGADGLKYYMVRPVKLQTTPSGSYYNLGIGTTDTATVDFPPLNVAAVLSARSLYVAPNPATDILNVYWPDQGNRAVEVAVYGNNGALLIKHKYQQSTSNSAVVDISALPAGMYMVQIATEQQTIGTLKWTKM